MNGRFSLLTGVACMVAASLVGTAEVPTDALAKLASVADTAERADAAPPVAANECAISGRFVGLSERATGSLLLVQVDIAQGAVCPTFAPRTPIGLFDPRSPRQVGEALAAIGVAPNGQLRAVLREQGEPGKRATMQVQALAAR